MSRKPQDNPEQSKRFIDMAREVEAAETKEEAERAAERILSSDKARIVGKVPVRQKPHAKD